MDVLNEATVDPDPLEQFARWYATGTSLDVVDPNAMTLATANRDGRPSARMVLLKSFDVRGFVFFTSYESRKGVELDENPWAALILYWASLRRQIRIEGRVQKVTTGESDAYFRTRARGSQIAARASQQSTIVAGREELEERVRAISAEYDNRDVPRPEYWGGYLVVPDSIEFWQGQRDRLHDRMVYVRRGDGSWGIERLSP